MSKKKGDVTWLYTVCFNWTFKSISYAQSYWRLNEPYMYKYSEPFHIYFPHLDFIVLPDGHGPDPVLGPELLGERSGHQASSDVRRGWKVTLPGFGAVRGDVFIQLHLLKSKTLTLIWIFPVVACIKIFWRWPRVWDSGPCGAVRVWFGGGWEGSLAGDTTHTAHCEDDLSGRIMLRIKVGPTSSLETNLIRK